MVVDATRSPTAFTIRLRALGQIELTATSGDVSAVLSQRKRVALLAYLALAGTRAPCGREMLATLFWPDSPSEAARHSLREALRLLRRALGADLIVTRASDDLGLDPSLMWTDVAEFERAIGLGRNDDAIAIYRGPLLEGFTLREVSSQFEHWLDGERARLHAMAIRAASTITDDAERAGNVMLASRAARDCVRLAPFDEVLFRRLLVVLERAGDAAGALHAYDEFAERLARDLEVAPSPETQAIVARLRGGTARFLSPSPGPPPKLRPRTFPSRALGIFGLTTVIPETITTPGVETVPSQSARPSGTPIPTPRWKRPLVVGLIVAGLTAIAALGYVLRSIGPSRAALDPLKPPTLAVLPFENLGAPNDEYFADGMTEELTGRLAKLSGIAVIARTSVMKYKKTTKPITQIAKELGADFLIEGSVRWEKTPDGNGHVRVGPQMIRASDGTHVWADQFDEPYGTGIFAIQSSIAERVARALDVKLRSGDERVVRGLPTANLAAYDAYIRAQSYLDREIGQDWEVERLALEALEQAVRLDSGFAPAQARLASLYVHFATGSGYDLGLGTGIAIERRWEMARAAAMAALASDSSSARAHRVLSEYYREFAGDTTRSRAELTLALRGEPSSADAITYRAWALVASGRADEALHDFERALSLDPRNPTRWLTIAAFHEKRGDLTRYGEALERAIAVGPSVQLYLRLTWQRLMIGRRDDAQVALRNAIAQAGVNSVVFRLAKNSSWINVIRILPEDLAKPAAEVTWATFGADSADYFWAKALAYGADPARSRAYFDSLAAWARPASRASGRAVYLRVILARALAGAGRRDEAARELDDLLRHDSQRMWREIMAESCLIIGRKECAVAHIAAAIDELPGIYPPAIFRLDPMWDPLRKRADFAKLVEGHD